jgi:hypothetical protein
MFVGLQRVQERGALSPRGDHENRGERRTMLSQMLAECFLRLVEDEMDTRCLWAFRSA